MSNVSALAMVIIASALMISCQQEPGTKLCPEKGERPLVAVTNYPLRFLVEQLAGDAVDVYFPVPPGEDPAYWQPTADEVKCYQAANLILLNGADYEKWTATRSLPLKRQVNTSITFRDQYLELEEAVMHSHGPGGEHSHHGTDFNIWLDLSLYEMQMDSVSKSLQLLLPAESSKIAERAELLRGKLDELDAAFAALVAQAPETPLLASHPVYNYFAHRHGIPMRSLHWEPGVMPDEQQWEEMRQLLTEQPVRFMLWEGEPSLETEVSLIELGVHPVLFETAGNPEGSGDFLAIMSANLERLRLVYAP